MTYHTPAQREKIVNTILKKEKKKPKKTEKQLFAVKSKKNKSNGK